MLCTSGFWTTSCFHIMGSMARVIVVYVLISRQRFHLDLRSLQNNKWNSYRASRSVPLLITGNSPEILFRYHSTWALDALTAFTSVRVLAIRHRLQPNFVEDQVFILGCGPGAKFAIYDCLVIICLARFAPSILNLSSP